MPKQEEDIAIRAHALRTRIYSLEMEHARMPYPDQRKELAEEIASLLTEYRELLPQIEREAEKRKQELKRERAATDRKRHDLLRLLGQVPEPVPTNAMGAPLGTAPSFEKAYDYPVADLRHYSEPTPWAPRLISKEEAAEFRRMDEPSYWLKEAS